MTSSRKIYFWALTTCLGAAGAAALITAQAAESTASMGTQGAKSVRLTASQYKLAVADIFGASIRVEGRFEPETRDQGMLAVGARTANMSDNGLEAYDAIARAVSAQVVDERHRDELIRCKPRSEAERDDACAREFFSRVGPALYRRPLATDEVEKRVASAGTEAARLHNFYAGVRLSLGEMLISPHFLYRFKRMEPDPARSGQQRMNANDKASELSFFFWNTTPDGELMRAAGAGELHTEKGLARQIDRLVESPRVAAGVRAFFADMLVFTDFEAVSKDPDFFPRFTTSLKEQAQEQTLRTIVHHVVDRRADYRDLFTTPETFLTSDLAALYAIPFVDLRANGEPQRWRPHTLPPDDPRMGILAQASFTTLWSPSGRTSPTVRGKALRENLLCQRVPPPPGNVEFTFVDDLSNPKYKTARDRLTAHSANPVCAGCHKITDPLGLALENFDSAGAYRTTENGARIDASGQINGVAFEGPLGLGRAVHDDPAATSCVAQRMFAFKTGAMPAARDARWQEITRKFAASNYNVLDLMREIALSDLAYNAQAKVE